MKNFGELKIGDNLYLYYRGMKTIETVKVIDLISNNTIRVFISNEKIDNGKGFELYGSATWSCFNFANHYTTFKMAKKDLEKDIKDDIKNLQFSKRTTIKLIDSGIKELKNELKKLPYVGI
jgi:hypothetical protein